MLSLSNISLLRRSTVSSIQQHPANPSKLTTPSSVHPHKFFFNTHSSSSFSLHYPSFTTSDQNSCKLNTPRKYPDAKSSNSSFIHQFADPNLLGLWLQTCRSLKEVQKLHALWVKCSGNSATFVDNNLISVYVKFGEVAEARKVFDKTFERNVVSWTAMLNGYLRFGLDDEALSLFLESLENAVEANCRTFVCALNLCSRRLDIQLGKQVHARILKRNCRNLIVDSAIVYFYAQCRDLSGAFRAFDGMPERDVVCWTTVVAACSRQGRGEEAFLMLSGMISEGFAPNEFTVCSALKACGEERELKFGRQLHGVIAKKGVKDDVFVGTSLVSMYAKCGEILDSRKVFDAMNKRNTVTWTSIIAGYAAEGLGEEAIRLFREMKKWNIFANNLTIVSILRACGSIESLQTGKEVHAQVIRNSLQLNVQIGSTLVWFYCKCQEKSIASKVLQQMPFKDVVSWTALISGFTQLGHELEALGFLKEMMGEGVEPNPFTYSSALKACAKLEDIWQGKLLHSSVNKTPAKSNLFVSSALINMYAKCGHVLEATQVFDSMPERNLVSWRAMIVGYAQNGHCKEALNLMYRMRAEGFEVDDYIMTTVISACGDFKWETGPSPEHCLYS
ncbi:Pentatricopeptide repeat [Dillenia turbinata]|uniref:Pentatricopeptide repeat n=1 Tax=Dillenia turbinata TaxID=194707 RepID=A0AAN8VS57_9MAGN